jgi:hypothetical protein
MRKYYTKDLGTFAVINKILMFWLPKYFYSEERHPYLLRTFLSSSTTRYSGMSFNYSYDPAGISWGIPILNNRISLHTL